MYKSFIGGYEYVQKSLRQEELEGYLDFFPPFQLHPMTFISG